MAIESDADRLAFLDDFGEDGIYEGTETLRGIYDAAYAEFADVAGSAPVFTCRTADVEAAAVADGGVLVIAAGTFTVRVPQADGTGMTILVLEKQ